MHLETLIDWGSWVWIGMLVVATIFFIKGWRVGLVPACIDLVSLFVGVFAGLVVGVLGALIIGTWLPWPATFTGLVLGFIVAISVFGLMAYLAPYIYEFANEILDEIIDNQSSFQARFVFSLGGGIVEMLFGLILVWMGLTIFIACGNTAETAIQKSNLPPNWVETTLVRVRDFIQGTSTQVQGAVQDASMQAKDAIQDASAKGMAVAAERISQPIAKLVQISENPDAMQRLKSYPDVKAFMNRPAIAAVLANPEVRESVDKKDYVALVQQPLVLRVAADYSQVSTLLSSDFQTELDALLTPPTPPPVNK